jgi:hypothetical protein
MCTFDQSRSILANFETFQPFLVGLFSGTSKPTSVADYLRDFVEEVQRLRNTPAHIHFEDIHTEDIDVQVNIVCLICDAAARSWLKGVIQYNGYFGCERCRLHGQHAGRVVYNYDAPGPLRTDLEFATRQYLGGHQPAGNPLSPLVAAGIGCITQIPLDSMHLVFLGATRQMVHEGNLPKTVCMTCRPR